jgi:hypothetical protein
MATKQQTRTYRIRREWTVVMESWIEVEAENVEAACAAAMQGDDYDDQEIAADSDGPTYIGAVERDGDALEVPYHWTEEAL